jgi:hypothetical protein
MNFEEINRTLTSGKWISSNLETSSSFSWFGRILKFLGFYKEYQFKNFESAILAKIQNSRNLTSSESQAIFNILNSLKRKPNSNRNRITQLFNKVKINLVPPNPKDLAASKIQKVFKGYQTRQHIILPSQIKTKLHTELSRFCTTSEIDVIATSIARHISTDLKKEGTTFVHSKKLRSTNYPLLKYNSHFKSYEYEKNRRVTYRLKSDIYDFCYSLSPDQKSIQVQLIPSESHHSHYINAGGYKKVYSSPKFSIPLSLVKGKREVDFNQRVAIKVISSSTSVTNGLNIQKEIFDKHPDVHIVTPPTYLEGSNKYEQEWYNCDLESGLKNNSIPSSLSRDHHSIPFRFKERLQIALDVTEALEAIQNEGYVHRDVKPLNILLKEKDGEIRGFLTDFDLSTPNKTLDISSNYEYWDICSKQGLSSSSSDSFGFAITLGEIFIPNFSAKYRKNPSLLLNDKENIIKNFNDKNRNPITQREFIKILDLIERCIKADMKVEKYLFNFPEEKKLLKSDDERIRSAVLERINTHLISEGRTFPLFSEIKGVLQGTLNKVNSR